MGEILLILGGISVVSAMFATFMTNDRFASWVINRLPTRASHCDPSAVTEEP